MQNDTREVHAEALQVLLPWGLPSGEAQDGWGEVLALWVTGGACLLLWTGLALLLTSS